MTHIYVPSCRRTSSHLATFCPICRQDKNVRRWVIPSADSPVCRRDASPDWPEHMCEQRLIWLHFVQSADGTSADWTSRLPTFCLICRQFVQSAGGTKCLQMGHPICRQSRLQTGRAARLAGTYMRTAFHLPTLCPIWWYFVQSADRTTVRRWDVLSTNGPVCRLDKMFVDGTFYLPTVPSADGTTCSQIYHPFCWQSRLQTERVATLA